MSLRPHEIYAHKLFQYNLGYALFDPDPQGSYDKVHIGDVGYVNDGGKFVLLFNAFREDGGPNIDGNGLPDKFKPFPVEKYRKPDPQGSINRTLASEGTDCKDVQVEAAANIPHGPVTSNIAVKFTSKKNSTSGALLKMAYGSDRKQATCTDAMETYMLKNCMSWLALAKKQGCSVELHDIVFVRERTLTGDCCAVTWRTLSNSSGASFDLNLIGSRAGFSLSGGTTGFIVDKREGPSCRVNGVGNTDANRPEYEAGKFDQCVFLKGIRVVQRAWFEKLVKMLKASVDDRESIDDSYILRTLKSVGLKAVSVGNPKGPFSEVKNAYGLLAVLIFQSSKADIAIIDDSEMTLFPGFSVADSIEGMCDVILDQKGIKVSTSISQDPEDDKGTAKKIGRIRIDEKYVPAKDKGDGILLNIGKKVKRTISFTPSTSKLTGGLNRTESTAELQTET